MTDLPHQPEPPEDPRERGEERPEGTSTPPNEPFSDRAKRVYDRASGEARRRWSQVEASREHSTAVDTAFQVAERDQRSAGALLAGAVAFRLFLWILPLLLVLVLTLSFFTNIENSDPTSLANGFGFSGVMASNVLSASQESILGRVLLLIGGLWALALTTRSFAKALWIASRIAWGVAPKRVPIKDLVPIGAALAGCYLLSTIANALKARHNASGLPMMLAMLLVYAGAWLFICSRLPRLEDVPWAASIPGAAVLGLGLEALFLASTLWFLPRMSRASEAYGSLGVAILVLGYLYLIGRLMVGSLMINATLWYRAHPESRPNESGSEPVGT